MFNEVRGNLKRRRRNLGTRSQRQTRSSARFISGSVVWTSDGGGNSERCTPRPVSIIRLQIRAEVVRRAVNPSAHTHTQKSCRSEEGGAERTNTNLCVRRCVHPGAIIRKRLLFLNDGWPAAQLAVSFRKTTVVPQAFPTRFFLGFFVFPFLFYFYLHGSSQAG